MEVCAKCGAVPIYRAEIAGDYDEPGEVTRKPVQCSNSLCEYSDENLLDNDWLMRR